MAKPDPGQEYDWLFVTEFRGVVRTAYLIVHDHARAEEIAQDSFLQLLRHWDKVRTYESPEAWVRRVAIRLATRDASRERRRLVLTRQTTSPERTAPPADARIDADLMSAIGRLSPRQRAVVVLFYYEDRPMDEIADIIGCSPATGWVHLHKARKALGALLSEEVDSDVD